MKMNKTAIALAVFGLTGAGSALAADGTIIFNGKITDQTCEITTPGGKNFTVTLPTVSDQALADAGQTAGRTPFAINLSNCSAGQVATYFEPGPTVDVNSGEVRLNNTASTDAATNVQVRLLGDNFGPIGVQKNGFTQPNSQIVTVVDGGGADLNYYAEYYATAAAGAGDVSTSVQYTIIYQ